jgi:hypothetical protein
MGLLFSKSREAPEDRWIDSKILAKALEADCEKIDVILVQLMNRGMVEAEEGPSARYRLIPSAIRSLDDRMGSYCPYL